MTQVRAYVDGFNLYHGLRQDGRKHLWLDLDALATSLLKLVNNSTASDTSPLGYAMIPLATNDRPTTWTHYL